LSIDTQGNVGIGTTNPLKKLDIIGDIRLTGSIYQNDNQALIYTGDGLRASADIAVRQVDPILFRNERSNCFSISLPSFIQFNWPST